MPNREGAGESKLALSICHGASTSGWAKISRVAVCTHTGWFAMIWPITFTPRVDKSCRDKTRVDRSCAFQTLSHSLSLPLSAISSQEFAQTFRLVFIREIDHCIVPFSIRLRHGKSAESRGNYVTETKLAPASCLFLFFHLLARIQILEISKICNNVKLLWDTWYLRFFNFFKMGIKNKRDCYIKKLPKLT